MNKKIFAICLIAVFLGLTQADGIVIVSDADDCSNHPIYKRLKMFAKTIAEKLDAADSTALKTRIEAFATHTPAADDTMVKCDAYKAEETCCTKEFTDLMPKLMKASFRRRMQARPKVLAAIKRVAMGTAQCKGQDAAKAFMEEMRSSVKEFSECRLKGVKAEINWQRGTLCAICSPPADLATTFKGYINDDEAEKHQLKVTQGSLDKYQAGMDASADCFNTENTSFKEKLAEWVEANLSGCTELQAKVKDMQDNEENRVTKPECKNSGMLGGGCLRHQEDDAEREQLRAEFDGTKKPRAKGDAITTTDGPTKDGSRDGTKEGTTKPSGTTEGTKPRMLQDSEDESTEYAVDADGVDAYQEDAAMDAEFDTIASEEDFSADLEGDLPEKEEGLDESESESSDSNASVLAISAMLALIMVLI